MKKSIVKFFISLIPAIILYFIFSNFLSNDIQIFGFLSYYYLIFVLLVTPVSYLFLKSKVLRKLGIGIITYRRILGIITGIFSFFHLMKFEESVSNLWYKFYSKNTSYTDFLIDNIFSNFGQPILGVNFYAFWFAFVSFLMVLLLFVTSNNISQRLLGAKLWKLLQRLVYPLFILVVLHIYFVGGFDFIYIAPGVLLILLRTFVFIDKKLKSYKKENL